MHMKLFSLVDRRSFLAGSISACLWAATGWGAAAHGGPPEAPVEQVAVPAPAQSVMVVDLPTCRAIALQRHPALAAYRASLATAQAKLDALERARLAALVRRDLPIRRHQASQGVIAAEAKLCQAEWDVLYGVTRMYFTAIYAQAQQDVADDAIDAASETGIRYLLDLIEAIDKSSKPQEKPLLREDIKEWDREYLRFLIQGGTARTVEAKVGKERALVALREAMGLEECVQLVLPGKVKLPVIQHSIDRDRIVALARSRRGELVQATVGKEVSSMEVEAQGRIIGLLGQTFASGSDLHAQPVPLGEANGDYRPGAIGLEMPPTLFGKRGERQTQAMALSERADAVVTKTRHLVVLQAEDAYLKWVKATDELDNFSKAAVIAEKIRSTTKAKFRPDLTFDAPLRLDRRDRPTLNEVLEAGTRAINLRLRVNQAKYDLLLSLTALERATAGGFQPGFDHPLPVPAPAENGEGKR